MDECAVRPYLTKTGDGKRTVGNSFDKSEKMCHRHVLPDAI